MNQNMYEELAQELTIRLQNAFKSKLVHIDDMTHLHAGHAHADGKRHLEISIISPLFDGLNRVERQRKVFAELKDELNVKIHSIRIQAFTPTEAKNFATP